MRDTKINLTIGYIDLSSGQGTINALRDVDPQRTDAVCLFAVDAPGVREEINRLVDQGVQVCTIVSDVSSSRRSSFIGFDNVAAGRTAGRMLDQMVRRSTGTVGVITGSNQIRDHIERYMGLTQSMALYRPGLRVLPAAEGHSRNHENQELVAQMIREHHDLVAVYSIAGGSIGVIDALQEAGVGKDIVAIVHELEPRVREALADGTINLALHQNTRSMMRLATEAMIAACEGRPGPEEKLVIEMYVAENLP
ncbi:Xylose regulator from LacI family [Candidatus Rhodobacter oscarellae]|uniref:Xylose regulator from LacI family n=1 Tax=Candidatus Rhodobacter oscarellae TaxID=1675527 RepID=A0A0J9E3E7_9RHOB|nr:Xylose regulator from LacI family [Candidatus Rhodobacter lobularis]